MSPNQADEVPDLDTIEAMTDAAAGLADWLAVLNLTPDQRRKLNAGTRALSRTRGRIEKGRNHPDNPARRDAPDDA